MKLDKVIEYVKESDIRGRNTGRYFIKNNIPNAFFYWNGVQIIMHVFNKKMLNTESAASFDSYEVEYDNWKKISKNKISIMREKWLKEDKERTKNYHKKLKEIYGLRKYYWLKLKGTI